MKEIQLTQGQVTIVDDADYEWLNQWSWFAGWFKGSRSFYAMRTIWNDARPRPKSHTQRIHRLIMGVTDPSIYVDHRNHNTLDNRRDNLRIATPTQNQANAGKRNGTSQYKGVSRLGKKWRAMIRINGKHIHLGCFANELDAALTYQQAARKHFGEFAHTPQLLEIM